MFYRVIFEGIKFSSEITQTIWYFIQAREHLVGKSVERDHSHGRE